MLIPVIYLNGKQDMVKDYLLNKLIEQRSITRFKRSEGWIELATGRIRSREPLPGFAGPERRRIRSIEAEDV